MKNIRVDHRVESADGTLYEVRDVNEATQTANLRPLDGGEYVDLPLAELKRVSVRRLPPIEGMPEGERPRCPYCGRLLRPVTDHEHERQNYGRVTRRTFKRWDGYAIERGEAAAKFCTLRCARDFANAAYRAGYRVTAKAR